MNKEINKTYNSLPEEEKEQLKKFEKKGITEVKQKVDQQTGEILSTETNYNSETKRKKGTFYIGSPLELQKIAQGSKVRAINKMLVYILDVVNWNNEFTFDKPFIESYGEKNKQRFFTDRKYLLENNWQIVDEAMVFDVGKYYTVIKALKCDKTENDYSKVQLEYGKLLLENRNPVLKEYLEKEYKKFSKIAENMKKEKSDNLHKVEEILEMNQEGRKYYD